MICPTLHLLGTTVRAAYPTYCCFIACAPLSSFRVPSCSAMRTSWLRGASAPRHAIGRLVFEHPTPRHCTLTCLGLAFLPSITLSPSGGRMVRVLPRHGARMHSTRYALWWPRATELNAVPNWGHNTAWVQRPMEEGVGHSLGWAYCELPSASWVLP